MDDDDFWTTYIAATPEEDRDFAGCWPMLSLVLVAVGVLILLAVILSGKWGGFPYGTFLDKSSVVYLVPEKFWAPQTSGLTITVPADSSEPITRDFDIE